MALTAKRARFAEEYLVDFNATQAAIRSGYAKSGAHTEGFRLLRDAEVAARIAELGQQSADDLGLTRGYVLTKLREVVERSLEGAPKTTGKGEIVYGEDGAPIIEWSPAGAKSALELLARIRGDLIDKLEHSGGITVRVNDVDVSNLR